MRLTIDRESKPLLYPIVNLSNFKKEIIHSGTLTPWCNLPFVEGEPKSLYLAYFEPNKKKKIIKKIIKVILCNFLVRTL